MLYNESTGKTAPVLSSASVIAWLEQQPADQSYNWHNFENCGAAQYLCAHERPLYHMDRIPDWQEIFMGEGKREEWTFGAALERARAMVPQ